MKKQYNCGCETSIALKSKDRARIEQAILRHVGHKCPDYNQALHLLIQMSTGINEPEEQG